MPIYAPHHIQYGGRYGDIPLGNSSGQGGRGIRRVQEGGAEAGHAIIRR